MKWLKNTAFMLMMLGVSCTINAGSPAYAILEIFGVSADATVPPPPTGLCSGGRTLVMTDGGSVTTATDATSIAVYKTAPYENSYGGTGYALGTSAANNTTLVTFDLDRVPTVVSGTLGITAANNPDIANQLRGNIYDPTRVGNGGFIVAGVQTTAPCVAGLANCVHFRGFTSTTLMLDLPDTSSVGLTGVSTFYQTSDTLTYWLGYVTAGGSILAKYNSSLGKVGALAATPNQYGDMTDDGTYVYTTVNIGGIYNIRRVRISDLSVTDFPLFGGTVSTPIIYVNGNLYVGQTGAIQKVRTSDMTVQGSLAIGGAEATLPGGFSYDSANDRLYSVGSGAGATQYRRINLNTFTSEQTLGVALVPQSFGTGFDFPHQKIWQITAGANMVIEKVSLCS